MLSSSPSKIHEPLVIGVSPRLTDRRRRQELRNTRVIGNDVWSWSTQLSGAGPGGRRNRAWSGLVTSRSAESTAPVHGRLGSLYRTVGVSPFCVGGGTTVRAGAVAIQSAIAARPTEP
jgi:hypothetical protein